MHARRGPLRGPNACVDCEATDDCPAVGHLIAEQSTTFGCGRQAALAYIGLHGLA